MNEEPQRSNRSVGWLRFIVWMMPTCMTLIFLLPAFLPVPFARELISLAVFGGIGYLAYYDALLGCQQRRIPREDPRAGITRRVVVFLLLQLLIVPLFWSTIAWGFCMLTGSGF
jgi:hypothetical protein